MDKGAYCLDTLLSAGSTCLNRGPGDSEPVICTLTAPTNSPSGAGRIDSTVRQPVAHVAMPQSSSTYVPSGRRR